MRTLRSCLIGSLAIASGLVYSDEPPKPTGLVERAERTLVQLTLKVRAVAPQDRELAAHLTKESFSVFMDGREILPHDYELDNFCPATEGLPSPDVAPTSKHLLFFVDRLGPEGQDNTKAMLQRMIPELSAEGFEMRVLPNTERGWTSDAGRLMRDAFAIFDPSVRSLEEHDDPPAGDVGALLASDRVDEAIAAARERELASQRTVEGPTLQLAEALTDMGALPSPKALIYFSERGQSFGEVVVDTAIRSGVAIYAVKADGMAPYDPRILKTADDPGAIITTSLSALSDHTGGRFAFGGFRKGAADKVVERVRSDLSCVYVLSFDAVGLDRDRTIRPRIKLNPQLKSHVTATTVPELTILGEERRQAQAVAFALRSGRGAAVQLAAVSLTPLAFNESKAMALIECAVDVDAQGPDTTAWDIGVNYFGASRVSGHGARRVTSPSSRIVFQKKVKFPAGAYSLVGIAQEVGGPGLARGTAVGVLERPKRDAVGFLHALDLMQWTPDVFVSEDGGARRGGWSPLRYGMAVSDRPLALVTSVCRGAGVRGPLTIAKSLKLPGRELRAPTTTWPEQGSPCRVVRDDVLSAGSLPWPNHSYEATLVVDVNDASGRTIAKRSTSFWVVGPFTKP